MLVWKESGFDVTDKISVWIEKLEEIQEAVKIHACYIGAQTLADNIELKAFDEDKDVAWVDIDDLPVRIKISRI